MKKPATNRYESGLGATGVYVPTKGDMIATEARRTCSALSACKRRLLALKASRILSRNQLRDLVEPL